MPWTAEQQAAAEKQSADFLAEYNVKVEAWRNFIQGGDSRAVAGQQAVEDVVRRWQQHLTSLQAQSDHLMSNENLLDELGQLANQVAEEKVTLQRLKGQAGTRADQADSVNPKVRGSPYTNILGLNRTFRNSTRTGLITASIVFGTLSLGVLVFLVYSVVTKGSSESYTATGGNRK